MVRHKSEVDTPEVARAGKEKEAAEIPVPSTAEPASADEECAALPSKRPRLGEAVDVEGAREQLVTTELVAEVLAHIP